MATLQSRYKYGTAAEAEQTDEFLAKLTAGNKKDAKKEEKKDPKAALSGQARSLNYSTLSDGRELLPTKFAIAAGYFLAVVSVVLFLASAGMLGFLAIKERPLSGLWPLAFYGGLALTGAGLLGGVSGFAGTLCKSNVLRWLAMFFLVLFAVGCVAGGVMTALVDASGIHLASSWVQLAQNDPQTACDFMADYECTGWTEACYAAPEPSPTPPPPTDPSPPVPTANGSNPPGDYFLRRLGGDVARYRRNDAIDEPVSSFGFSSSGGVVPPPTPNPSSTSAPTAAPTTTTPSPGSETAEPATPNPGSETAEPATPNPGSETAEPTTPNPGSETAEPTTPNPGSETAEPTTPNPGSETAEPTEVPSTPNPTSGTASPSTPQPTAGGECVECTPAITFSTSCSSSFHSPLKGNIAIGLGVAGGLGLLAILAAAAAFKSRSVVIDTSDIGDFL